MVSHQKRSLSSSLVPSSTKYLFLYVARETRSDLGSHVSANRGLPPPTQSWIVPCNLCHATINILLLSCVEMCQNWSWHGRGAQGMLHTSRTRSAGDTTPLDQITIRGSVMDLLLRFKFLSDGIWQASSPSGIAELVIVMYR